MRIRTHLLSSTTDPPQGPTPRGGARGVTAAGRWFDGGIEFFEPFAARARCRQLTPERHGEVKTLMPDNQQQTPLQTVQNAYAGAYNEWQGVTDSREQLQTQMASPAAINSVAEREEQALQVATKYYTALQAFENANVQTRDDLRNQPEAQLAYNAARETHIAYTQRYPAAPGRSSVAQSSAATQRQSSSQQQQGSDRTRRSRRR